MDKEAYQRRIDELRRNPERIEVMDDDMAEVLRRMTGAERLAIANDIFIRVREMYRSDARSLHPDWTEKEVNLEAGWRMLSATR